MRVAILHFLDNPTKADEAVLENVKEASGKNGNTVTVINALKDASANTLMMHEYIAVIIRPEGVLSARVPDAVQRYFRGSGSLSGKKGCALVLKSGLRSGKTCRNLMELLEAQGLLLDYFDVISDAAHALTAGAMVG
ncbi:MAG TPA: hypothetical protein PLP41_01585 [Treponemataceae bacterium]|jgi:hypothetical protein|nr:hypothetical protein [Treponema sp.]HOF84389.1 hypothetical protein [Treponemataceae bacterium]HOS34814.1 hypothetical protein [Treponemataceae bacterium]HOU37576.1 hypothetical protein [Treponemataceae bacterium]HPL91255.1 hypothetical protein [Treponemataceae bacterium]